MPDRNGLRSLSSIDVAYLAGRSLITCTLAVMYLVGLIDLSDPPHFRLVFQVGLILFALTTVAVLSVYLVRRPRTRLVLWVALPFDYLSSSLLIAAVARMLDPMYVWMLGIAVIYAVGLPRRQSQLVAVATAFVYLTAHYFGHGTMHGGGDYILLLVKASGIVLFAYFISLGMFRQQLREAELENSRADITNLNVQLQRRLAELNAVSEITEVIHSTLDFDIIGPTVLEIIQKVIDVPACSLLVLDKEKAETLFTASKGLGGLPPNVAGTLALSPESELSVEGGLFSCLTILDHSQMMVVFCAAAEHVEKMRVEDRLVLQAVASELAVAVENSQLYKLTKRLSITDELTGLYNYRYLQQRLDDEFERAQRYERSLSLLMIDADDFKLFNDSFGHLAGDQALGELGSVLKSVVREIDVAGKSVV